MEIFFYFKNIAYFIPTISDILIFLIILFLTSVFDQYGHLIVKKKCSLNFFVGWGIFYLIVFFLNFLLKIYIDKVIIFYLIFGLLLFLKNYNEYFFYFFF